MDKVEKVEFGSAAWVRELRRIFEESLAEQDIAEIDFSMCEEFTDPPAHLKKEGRDTIGWHCRIRDGKLEVHDEPANDVDVHITGDYNTVLPMARMVLADEPTEEARLKRMAENMAKLRIEGVPTKIPEGFMEKLDLHDKLAVITA